MARNESRPLDLTGAAAGRVGPVLVGGPALVAEAGAAGAAAGRCARPGLATPGGGGAGTSGDGAEGGGGAAAAGATDGSLTVGAAVGLGGKVMRTVSFLGWTLAASVGLGGTAPPGTFGVFSAITKLVWPN